MSADKDYTNEAQQRLLKVVMLLGEDVITGFAPSQIAKTLNVPPGYITRDLDNLKTAGWAIQQEETGRWMLGAKPGALGVRVMASIDRAERKVSEARNRFTRNALD
jgi:DNA-binding IclR family transcriptional regulator